MVKIHTRPCILFIGINGGLLVRCKVSNNLFTVAVVFSLSCITFISYQIAAGL